MTEKRKGIRGGITVALAVLRVWFLALYRGGIYPFGDKSILCIDLYGQYTHFLGFLKNSSPSEFLYSFTKGFGGNTFGLFAYYCISVFNLLVFFFDSMEATAFAIITAKLVFRGLCMYIYMRKTSKSMAVSVGAAVAYGVYPYFIFYYCNIIWFDCFALLPILVLGTEYVADGKKPWLFMAVYTYCLYSNYYIAAMFAVFILIYFFWYSLFLKGYDWKLTVKRTVTMAYAAIVPILLACPVIIPSIKALSGGKVSDFIFFTDRKKPMTNYIWAFACAISGNFNFDQSPVLFAGVLEFCFAVMFFVSKKYSKREKTAYLCIFAVILLMMYVPQIYYMWHGFAWPEGFGFRESCIFYFLFLSTAAKGAEEFSLKTLLPAAVIALLSWYFAGKLFGMQVNKLFIILMAVLILGAFGDKIKNGAFKWVLGLLWVTEAVCISSPYLIGDNMPSQKQKFRTDNKVNALKSVIENIDDKSFYRLEDTDPYSYSQAMSIGYYGTSHFSSLFDNRQKEMYEYFGYEDTFYSTIYSRSIPYIDSFWGIKYIFNSGSQVPDNLYEKIYDGENGENILYRNPYRLPIIFTGDTRSIEYSENWRQYIDNMYVALTGVETLDENGNRDYEKLEVVSRAINQNAVKMIKQQGNTIKFSAKGKYALATIMYDDCWHIKVNGKKVAPQKFMTWFTAVPLEEGENIVEMTYIPRGFVPGLCLMAAGAFLLIAGVLLKDRVFNKEGRLC